MTLSYLEITSKVLYISCLDKGGLITPYSKSHRAEEVFRSFARQTGFSPSFRDDRKMRIYAQIEAEDGSVVQRRLEDMEAAAFARDDETVEDAWLAFLSGHEDFESYFEVFDPWDRAVLPAEFSTYEAARQEAIRLEEIGRRETADPKERPLYNIRQGLRLISMRRPLVQEVPVLAVA